MRKEIILIALLLLPTFAGWTTIMSETFESYADGTALPGDWWTDKPGVLDQEVTTTSPIIGTKSYRIDEGPNNPALVLNVSTSSFTALKLSYFGKHGNTEGGTNTIRPQMALFNGTYPSWNLVLSSEMWEQPGSEDVGFVNDGGTVIDACNLNDETNYYYEIVWYDNTTFRYNVTQTDFTAVCSGVTTTTHFPNEVTYVRLSETFSGAYAYFDNITLEVFELVTPSTLEFNFTPTYPLVEQTTNFTVTNYTDFSDFYWDFGDGSPLNYTDCHAHWINGYPCYQETANITPTCGGTNTGTYSANNNWNDGNFSSYDDTLADLYVNYTVPDNAALSCDNFNVTWRVKDNRTGEFNITDIETYCDLNSTLQLHIQNKNTFIRYLCIQPDGSERILISDIHNIGTNQRIYEEGIWWPIINQSKWQHNFNTSGLFNVTLIATKDGTNETQYLNVSVYDNLTSINLNLEDKMPFIFKNPDHLLNYTNIGGTPLLTSQWNITLPNTTVLTFVTDSVNLPLTAQGTYTLSLRVCDQNEEGTCASNSTTFRAWNVTGAVAYVDSFNKTEGLIAQTFNDQRITLSSLDSIVWTLGTSTTGTSATFTLSESYAYWSNEDYAHYNITLLNTWGSYSKTEWITAITANYSIDQSVSCSSNLYCIVGGLMYDNSTQLTTGTAWEGLLETSYGLYHTQESSFTTADNELNITMCINATPLVSTLVLDGVITYSATGYAERTYAFQDASISLTPTCTVANGKYISFYTIPDTETSTVTITVLQGGISLDDALVKIQEYDGNWHTVASQITDTNGQVQMELELCPTYYKILIEKEGSSLYEEKSCLKSTSHQINIDAEGLEWYEVWEDIVTSCTWNNITEYLSCSVSDTSGKTTLATMAVYPSWSTTSICTTSEASTSTTLVCNMGSEADGNYKYELEITTSTDTYLINFGSFTKGTGSTVNDGSYFAVLFLLIPIIISIRYPVISVAVVTLGLIGLNTANMISLTGASIGWLITITIVVIVRLIK